MITKLNDRDRAILWARQMLEQEFVVLDTETTGLEYDAEACQIGIVSKTGEVLLDQLIKPHRPIPAQATRLHGITNEMVQDAPGFEQVYPHLLKKLNGKIALIYNRDFDWRILKQSMSACDIEPDEARPALWLESHCVMEWFAQFYGDWNDYHQSYKWQKLIYAARYFDLPTDGAHGAATDALIALRVVEGMSRAQLSTEETITYTLNDGDYDWSGEPDPGTKTGDRQ